MRDPRFGSNEALAYACKRSQEAMAVNLPEDVEAGLLKALQEACNEHLRCPGTDLGALFVSALGQPAQGFEPLAVEVRKVLDKDCGRGPEVDPLTDRADILVGEAMGKSLTTADPAWNLYESVYSAVELTHFAVDRVNQAILARCRESADYREKWQTELTHLPGNPAEFLASYLCKDPALLEGLKREIHSHPSQLWQGCHGHLIISSNMCRRFHLLERMSPTALLPALEQAPTTGIRIALVQSLRLFEDREFLLAGLKEFPAAYDQAGAWSGAAMPFLLLDEVLQHVAGLWTAEERRIRVQARMNQGPVRPPSTLEEELTEFLRQAFAVLLARPEDGVRLAIEFAVELTKRTTFAHLGGPRPWDVEAEAKDILLDTLIAHGVRAPQVRTFLDLDPERPPNDRMHYLLVAASLDHLCRNPDTSQNRPREAGVPSEVWGWYEENLSRFPECVKGQVGPNGNVRPWVWYVLASALEALPDACERWQQTWALVYPLRLRARFDPETDGHPDASRNLLEVGRSVLAFREAGAMGVRERTLWKVLCQREKELWLGLLPWQLRSEIPEVHAVLGLAGHVMGPDWREPIRESAGVFLANGLVALATAWLLVKHDLPAQDVQAIFLDLGCDLVEMGKAMSAWQEICGKPKENRTDIHGLLGPFLGLHDSCPSVPSQSPAE